MGTERENRERVVDIRTVPPAKKVNKQSISRTPDIMYDIAVVGAGPAGSMAAWMAALKGLSVVMFDRRKEVGVPIQCGEGVSHHALISNGVEPDERWIRQRISGARIFVPNEKHVLITGKGYAIDRAAFDGSIAELAVGAGADLRLSTLVTSMTKGEDSRGTFWKVGIRGRGGGGGEPGATHAETIEARFMVGADGPHSVVAAWAGIPYRPENVLGFQYKFAADHVKEHLRYEFRGSNRLQGEWLDFHYANRWPDGYVWVFPRGDMYNIGICGPGNLGAQLDAYCREHGLDPARKLATEAGQIPRGTVIPEFVKDNVLIVGDAAGLTNPLTKGGIHASLFSGRQAGIALAEAVETGNPEAARAYEMVMKGSKFTDPAMMEHGKLIYSLNDTMANFVGDLLDGRDFREFTCTGSMAPLMRNPRLIPFVPRMLKILKALEISSVYGW